MAIVCRNSKVFHYFDTKFVYTNFNEYIAKRFLAFQHSIIIIIIGTEDVYK